MTNLVYLKIIKLGKSINPWTQLPNWQVRNREREMWDCHIHVNMPMKPLQSKVKDYWLSSAKSAPAAFSNKHNATMKPTAEPAPDLRAERIWTITSNPFDSSYPYLKEKGWTFTITAVVESWNKLLL